MLYAILAYLAVLVGLGLLHATRLKTGDDFLVAGRTLPAHVLVFTLLATWIGSGSLFGGAGLGYRAGFPALWQSAGAWTGIALVYFLAHRVRRIAKYTMPDILELRYGAAARVLGTIVVVIAYTTIAAYQFRGGGRLLTSWPASTSRTARSSRWRSASSTRRWRACCRSRISTSATASRCSFGVGLAAAYL